MEKTDITLILLLFMLTSLNLKQTDSAPLSCNISALNSCKAFLYFVSEQSSEQVAGMFSVPPSNVSRRDPVGGEYLINVTCGCDRQSNDSFATTYYLVQKNDSWDSISSAFHGLIEVEKGTNLTADETVELKVFCGCLNDVGVVSYQVVAGDTLIRLCDRFKNSIHEAKQLNGIVNENNITEGQILFFPLRHPEELISQEGTDHSSDSVDGKKSAHESRTGLIIGIACGVFFLVAAMIVGGFYLRSKSRKQGEKTFSNYSEDLKASKDQQEEAGSTLHHIGKENFKTNNSASIGKGYKSFSLSNIDSDKPVVFTYNDILLATDNLHESKKIGQGSYGAVYLGNLMNQMVAIKQMKDTKSKEFLAELKILCRVHHTNLVGLIGYSAGGEHLFLVYEFAENGALSDCLHDPLNKGHEPLSWTMRVQIALDAARGLEYIHEHTKPIYVHRDVKTSNILLDSDFRAKIADFGLVKLLEHSPGNHISPTKVVGTFGYLAPEYVRDGVITTKSDVYAFGVVLMELITAQPALYRGTGSSAGECRSLISLMSIILNDANCTSKLKDHVDKCLLDYPEDGVMQMALLSKACAEDDPNARPAMRDVVLSLSQLLNLSNEWESETTETGNSQNYSDLYYCR